MANRPRLRNVLRRKDLRLDDQALQYLAPSIGGTCDLVIGLDFGTSATKVVIQAPDLPNSPSYPVNFESLAHTSSPYLLPTKLWVKGAKYSLSPLPDGDVISNLKTALLGDSLQSMDHHSERKRRDLEARAAIYLAFVLRYSRTWFLKTKASIVRQFKHFYWSVNMGVPSPCVEDTPQNRSFRRVGMTAWMLSLLPEEKITLSEALKELSNVEDPEYWEPGHDLFCDFEIIPEIAAGSVGYALSGLRRDGLHVMVDIGASTVDVCTFLLNKEELSDRYSLLIADVQQIGIAKVHHERIAAVERLCESHADWLRNSFEPLEPLPESIEQYVITEKQLMKAVREAHDRVIDQFDLTLRGAIWKTKLRRHRKAPEWSRGKLPVLMIGGGSHEVSFRSAVHALDGWLKQHTRNDGVSVLPVPVPDSFLRSGNDVSEVDQGRLAVAWGLSHRALDVGEIIPADRIPDEPPPRLRGWRENYVGKEVV